MSWPTVLTLVQVPNGCAAWRVCWPAYALAERGYPVAWNYQGNEDAARQMEICDLVVMQRMNWSTGDEWKGYLWREILHDGGIALGYETDDDVYSEGVIERIRKTGDEELNARSDAQLEQERKDRIFALQLADGVTCSTPALAEVVLRYTDKPIAVVPNAIDLPRFRAAIGRYADRPRSLPLTIGWAGGNRPDTDALQVAEAWGRVARRYPDVQFAVGGYALPALIAAVPEDQLVYIPKRRIGEYPATFAEIDIGCCPLADELFNRSKSPIKAMEYGAAGAAVVASPTVYGDFLTANHDGLICETADDWEAALVALIERPDLREQLAANLLEKVERRHTLAGNLGRWPSAWEGIVQSFRNRHAPAPDQPVITGARG